MLAGAAVLACGAGSDQGHGPSASAAEPSAIAHVHRARCGSCHLRVEPGERTRAQLEAAFVRHRRRVHLSEDDWARMVDYLAARGDAG